MGCELEVRQGETQTEPISPSRSRGIERVCSRFGAAQNKSEHILTQQSDFKMAATDDKLVLNSDQSGNVREPVESIDSTILYTRDRATSDDKLEDDTVRETRPPAEIQPQSSLRNNSPRSGHSLGDEQRVSNDVDVSNEPIVTNKPNARNELNVNIEKKSSDGSNVSNEHSNSISSPPDTNIREKIHRDLEQLKDRLDTCTDIPELLHDVSLNCLKPSTIDYISYHLDPESDVLSPDGRCKDYRGVAEWIGLEPVFIRYISRSSHLLKTREVLSKWLTIEVEPLPNLKNLKECLLCIDRPDVLEDMAIKMARDAVTWKMTEYEAQTQRPASAVDTSWQLTRHDVVTGKETFYTCCLVYADEDEGMVQIFTKLYKSVYSGASFFLPQFDLKQGKFIYDTTAQVIEERCGGKVIFIISEYFFASNVCRFAVNFCKDMESLVSGKKTMYTACLLYADEDELMAQLIIKLYKTAYRDALFFLPQFDLKHGKYILDTTAKVIDERCDKKVVFLLSEYFYASHICQFAVNYAAAHGTGHGNLIPFHLTRNITSVPNVLKGIAGIRWFRKGTRVHTWDILTDSLLAEKMANKELLMDIKVRIEKLVEKDKEYYLQDPPYDDDVGPPGEPIEIDEPEDAANMPLPSDFEFKKMKMEEELQRNQEKKPIIKFLKQVKRAILEKVLRRPSNSHNSQGQNSSSSSQSGIPMATMNVNEKCEVVSDSNDSSNKQTSASQEECANGVGSELGAVGGVTANMHACKNLHLGSESKRKDCKSIIKSDSPRSESKSSIPENGNRVKEDCFSSRDNENNGDCSSLHIRQLSNTVDKDKSDIQSPSQPRNHTGEIHVSSPTETLDLNDDIESEMNALISEDNHNEGSRSNIPDKDAAEETDTLVSEA